ncbi:LysR family transcriptional regulator [Inhella proteolytica]|uniref:LysR family transcriptional regulator n=1 Tax=Inhella proteolytica TaxID=2795029 RepID=A0A931NJI4_9BURK|nr:LysR substrate-binding domain-containing protein [Inhella proteolytica]MBH9578675.1 LysR family transcriptional regulator [Inhella proteolytica]
MISTSGFQPGTEPLAMGLPAPMHCLQAFEALGRSGSLVMAAGELRLTPSALSQSLALLEDRLGIQLVRSLTPQLELTAAGERYLGAVQRFFAQVRDGLYEHTAQARARLHVTAPQALSRMWLGPRLAGFLARHPRVDLVLTATDRYASLGAGGVDIALRMAGPEDGERTSIPLWCDDMVAAASPRLAEGTEGWSAARIAAHLPLIDHPVANWAQWLAGSASGGSAGRVVMRCNDLHLAIEAAVQSIGVAIAPKLLIADRVRRGELVVLSTHVLRARTYRAVIAQGQEQRPPVHAFLAWLQEQLPAQS